MSEWQHRTCAACGRPLDYVGPTWYRHLQARARRGAAQPDHEPLEPPGEEQWYQILLRYPGGIINPYYDSITR